MSQPPDAGALHGFHEVVGVTEAVLGDDARRPFANLLPGNFQELFVATDQPGVAVAQLSLKLALSPFEELDSSLQRRLVGRRLPVVHVQRLTTTGAARSHAESHIFGRLAASVPFPPVELMQRVGRVDDPDVEGGYARIGRESRDRIERLLPSGWSWEGKRVLDFGCGAGRTLRHFLSEAANAEFYGCDIDEPSVRWASEHLGGAIEFFTSGEAASLPQADEFFDVVYALS